MKWPPTSHGNKYPFYRKWSLNKEFAVQSLYARRDHICQIFVETIPLRLLLNKLNNTPEFRVETS